MITEFLPKIGICIEVIDKPNKTNTELKLFCPEITPMYDDTTTTNFTKYSFDIVDKNNNKKTIKVDSKLFIEAEYYNDIPNRNIPPTIHPGEQVEIFQLGEPDKFYWRALNRDHKKRTTEVYEFIVSDRPENKADNEFNGDYWYVKIDTRNDKLIEIKTTMSDGEEVGYTIKVHPKEKVFYVEDTETNIIKIESLTPRIYLKNKSETSVDLNKEDLFINANRDIRINAGRQIVVDTKTYTANYEIAKISLKALGIAASQVLAIETPVVGINGTMSCTGPCMLGPVLAPGFAFGGPGQSITLPTTTPGNSSEESKAGSSTSTNPSTPGFSSSARHACAIEQIKPAIEAIDAYCKSLSGVGPTNPSYGGAGIVSSNLSTAKMEHVTDE